MHWNEKVIFQQNVLPLFLMGDSDWIQITSSASNWFTFKFLRTGGIRDANILLLAVREI